MKPNAPQFPLADRLAELRQMLAGSRATLLAASKSQPMPVLEEAIRFGVRDFGENKVQEAAEKWPALKAVHPDTTLHLIGPLQSNKAGEAVALFDMIHTIDRVKIADALAAEMKKQGRALPCLIQVNIGEEPQKAGATPQELPALLDHCRSIGLNIVGLMCIPPAEVNAAPYFALLAKLAKRHGLRELSMGMSDDAPAAIRLGATYVRIGTRLFGARPA